MPKDWAETLASVIEELEEVRQIVERLHMVVSVVQSEIANFE